MAKGRHSVKKLLVALQERAKELNCLYRVEALAADTEKPVQEVFDGVVSAIPDGWQYPDKCVARIITADNTYQSPGFRETEWVQSAEIVVQEQVVGSISVYYTEEMPQIDAGPFLNEERKLIDTIADRLGHYILYQRLKPLFRNRSFSGLAQDGWDVILDLVKKTDLQLYARISRKMANYLGWRGIKESEELLGQFVPDNPDFTVVDSNRPEEKKALGDISATGTRIFEVARKYLNENEGLALIQKWIKEDKSRFLVNVLEDQGSSLAEIVEVIQRYYYLEPDGVELEASRVMGFRVSLIRRLLTDQPAYVNIAKHFINMSDFHNILQKVIYPVGSYGKLGGKSAGILLASKVLEKAAQQNDLLKGIHVPNTWYLTSDCIIKFIHYNNLDDIVEQKYKEIAQIRQEYPYIRRVFKNSQFPTEIVNGLSMALDDFGDCPLIVRSSSLLEDRMGAAFAGKYKSLFLANIGTKSQRLQALIEAIAEVYASAFGPDPIEYRLERGLVDVHEEMGIMIQEVVGHRIGDYFLPSFAGVAFSNNEFRWSKRIRTEDGLVRLVPGLGTRAVDRLSDDYPVLASPGQPGIGVNATVDEKIHYSPRKLDVINLKTGSFDTIDFYELFKSLGHDYPGINQIVSLLAGDHLRQPVGLDIDFEEDFPVVTFGGLFANTPFLQQVNAILKELQDKFATAVDIEYAHDGTRFYLLQCRPQSYGAVTDPVHIPTDIPPEKIVFSANRYVSNGLVNDISHIVYVDPMSYRSLPEHKDLMNVGRVVGALNRVLPRRKFILMGPGRWGSRGDIKLGVSVTYSDINNAAMLIEIARNLGGYLPEVSFGTHFFHDLVEGEIAYLPLYPDDPDVVFSEDFLGESANILPDLLPEFSDLSNTVRVIDVPNSCDGLALQVYMDAESDRAIGALDTPTQTVQLTRKREALYNAERTSDDHWRWRHSISEKIAKHIDPGRFGVQAVYLFGSTKNATAGPASDIDLLIHLCGTEKQKRALDNWLQGWSKCLSEMNYLQTGIKTDGLLDIHYITDADITAQSSFAAKIGAVTDPALLLPLGKETHNGP